MTRRPSRRTAALCLLAGLAPAAAGAAAAAGRAEAATADVPLDGGEAAATAGVPYRVRIEGVDGDGRLAALIDRSSLLVTLAERPPPSQAALLGRIEADRDRFQAVLRSQGHYAGTIDGAIDEQTQPQTVVMRIAPGPVFTLKSFTVSRTDDGPDEAADGVPLPGVNELGLRIGQPARAADVLAAERRVLTWLADRARPLAALGEREAIVDHADQSMTVAVRVDPGPFVGFGPVAISGLDRLDEDYVRLLVPWQPGEPYDRRKVEEFRRKLMRLGLFSTFVVTPAEVADADGNLPVAVELGEAKARSIGGGFKYYTTEGPAAEAFWEHRNLLGRDEDLRITLEVGQIAQNLAVDALVPNYRRPDQELVGQVVALRETTDAFDRTGVETLAQLRRVFGGVWAVGAGVSLETSWIRERGKTDNSTLLGFPAFILRDSTDNPLHPTEGWKLRFGPTPYVGWYIDRQTFMTNDLSGSAYLALDRDRRYVLAGRTKIGTLFGESRDTVPADKRYYAGGGSSIRGYPYQKVGPLDSDNDPIGGRSLLEVSAELRARVWGNFGVVPFVDGGTVFTSSVPDFSETMRWGAGLGFRYHTAIGPVRLDLATPINPRDDVDEPIQFYISLGQSF
jgi:translocation and assembly module TamA